MIGVGMAGVARGAVPLASQSSSKGSDSDQKC